MSHFVPTDHPRAQSLLIRERLEEGFSKNLVAKAGLFAHGRGEAFDYLIGEQSPKLAQIACQTAVCAILCSSHPIISINGNVAALVPSEIVELGKILNAQLEVNLFYRTKEREQAIKGALIRAGATEVLGLGENRETIPELSHLRRFVDPEGIYKADCVVVPLEDGDRTEALKKLGKTVITIDLNPMSRTSLAADITIVDNVVRAVPILIDIAKQYKSKTKPELEQIMSGFDNLAILNGSLEIMKDRLSSFIPNLTQD